MSTPPAPPSPGSVRVAAVQMVSKPDVAANLRDASALIGEATSRGARLVALPEYFCLMGRDMALAKPAVAVEVAPVDGGFRVILSAPTLARHVRLAFDADDGAFSDNYFDLLPGRSAEVVYRPKREVEAEAFRKGLEVVSILDAY